MILFAISISVPHPQQKTWECNLCACKNRRSSGPQAGGALLKRLLHPTFSPRSCSLKSNLSCRSAISFFHVFMGSSWAPLSRAAARRHFSPVKVGPQPSRTCQVGERRQGQRSESNSDGPCGGCSCPRTGPSRSPLVCFSSLPRYLDLKELNSSSTLPLGIWAVSLSNHSLEIPGCGRDSEEHRDSGGITLACLTNLLSCPFLFQLAI